jgi:2,3-bisphosphoglycerate-dependent phosphoglycerate mutase
VLALTRFIAIRHGETEWNVEGRVQGHGDSPLTAAGTAQAEAIAQRLAGEKFDVLVASDLGRAAETARRIAARCGHPIVTDARLRERNFGAGEGLTYDEIALRYPDAFSRTRSTDPGYAIPGGESRRAFHERVSATFDALARQHAGRRVTVVSHGGVLAAIYRSIHGIAIDAPHHAAITNASYNAFAAREGLWTLEAWDDTSHLAAPEPFAES